MARTSGVKCIEVVYDDGSKETFSHADWHLWGDKSKSSADRAEVMMNSFHASRRVEN